MCLYHGWFKDDKFHYRGRLLWENGDLYEGSFIHGSMDGTGSFVSGSEKFIGTYTMGKRQGPGYLVGSAGAKAVEYDKDKIVSET